MVYYKGQAVSKCLMVILPPSEKSGQKLFPEYKLPSLCGVTLQPWVQLMAWKLLAVTKALSYRLSVMKMMMIMMTITTDINRTLITINAMACSLVFLLGK